VSHTPARCKVGVVDGEGLPTLRGRCGRAERRRHRAACPSRGAGRSDRRRRTDPPSGWGHPRRERAQRASRRGRWSVPRRHLTSRLLWWRFLLPAA